MRLLDCLPLAMFSSSLCIASTPPRPRSHTRKLLNYYSINTPAMSFHAHNEKQQAQLVLQRLANGEVRAPHLLHSNALAALVVRGMPNALQHQPHLAPQPWLLICAGSHGQLVKHRRHSSCTALLSLRPFQPPCLIAGLTQALALVSDAGTPAISDPGAALVAAAAAAGVRIIPVPGCCALVAALVAAGLPTDSFLFCGFLPPKVRLAWPGDGAGALGMACCWGWGACPRE